jgi:hypothetical protein
MHNFIKIGEFGEGTTLHLENNGITRLESAVFQSILEKMEPFSTIFGQDTIIYLQGSIN